MTAGGGPSSESHRINTHHSSGCRHWSRARRLGGGGTPRRARSAADRVRGRLGGRAHVAAWGHVQVFSPWRYNGDAVAAKLLRAHGWAEPDPGVLPTGAELIAHYLQRLAAVPDIAPHIRLNAHIIRITRAGTTR
jgi:hypothetical protein